MVIDELWNPGKQKLETIMKQDVITILSILSKDKAAIAEIIRHDEHLLLILFGIYLRDILFLF